MESCVCNESPADTRDFGREKKKGFVVSQLGSLIRILVNDLKLSIIVALVENRGSRKAGLRMGCGAKQNVAPRIVKAPAPTSRLWLRLLSLDPPLRSKNFRNLKTCFLTKETCSLKKKQGTLTSEPKPDLNSVKKHVIRLEKHVSWKENKEPWLRSRSLFDKIGSGSSVLTITHK